MGKPLITSNSRVFIIEGRARPDHAPAYHSSLRAGALAQGFGDVERIEEPDPDQYGQFIEVGEVVGANERPTTSLEGRYALDLKSQLLRLAKQGCALDIQLHFGACQDPRQFDEFEKIVILEGARLINWETEDIGALASDDNAAINESADISAKLMYEIKPVGYGVKAAGNVTNEVLDVTVCGNVSCGECEDEGDGCDKIYAITKAAGGSPSTPADVLVSRDGGAVWDTPHDIESLGVAEDPNGITCFGAYLVVISADSCSLHYALLSDFDGVSDPAWTEVTTGFVAGGCPNDISYVDGVAFIVGAGGYIYLCTDPTAGVSVLDAGAATPVALRRVHALSSEFAVAVGNSGVIVFTSNGTNWAAAEHTPVGFGVDLVSLWVKNETEWWVGTNTGRLFYTLNQGKTWTEKAFYGSGTGVVWDIYFSTESVGWISHTTTAPRGRILRTYNGGYSWKVTPEGTSTLPANDRIDRLGGCPFNPDFIVGVGLADDGADGFIVIGNG